MQGLHGLHGRVGAATGGGREKQEIGMEMQDD
jgi:hypothetical protein